jgi:hypothetical protein
MAKASDLGIQMTWISYDLPHHFISLILLASMKSVCWHLPYVFDISGSYHSSIGWDIELMVT